MHSRHDEERTLLTVDEALSVATTRGERRRRRRRGIRAAPAVLAVAAVIASGAVVAVSRHPASGPAPSRPVTSTIPIIFQVPDGTQDPPMALTGGQGDSVWYWDAQSQDPTIYRVSGASRGERAYQLGSGCCGAGLEGPAGLTVAPDGTVWGVINETLVELDPASGHATFFDLTSLPAATGATATDILIGDGADLVAISPKSEEA